MKTINKLQILILLLLLITTTPVFSTNTVVDKAPTSNTVTIDPKTELMLKRLEEIKEMDKSNLSRDDKKALRKEVKAIKVSMMATNHRVYLSVGAIIIIVLLLILIF